MLRHTIESKDLLSMSLLSMVIHIGLVSIAAAQHSKGPAKTSRPTFRAYIQDG